MSTNKNYKDANCPKFLQDEETAKYIKAMMDLAEAKSKIEDMDRKYAELMAEVHSLSMILAHSRDDNNALREENAALTKALDEVVAISGTFQGLTPTTRAICERLFGGGK